jgi:hypothetical protein
MATQLKQPTHGSPSWFYACIEKAHEHPVMETVMLTPALAVEMLKQNPGNRNIRQTKVDQYAADMKDGRWAFNGEPIIVSKDGKLNDGQHRCTAVVDANASIEVPIIFGIERETRTTVDQGAARGAADYLGMDGVDNSAVVASAARLIIAYRANEGQSLYGAKLVTHGAITEFASHDRRISASATFASRMAKSGARFAAVSIFAFAHHALSAINPVDAEFFLEQVAKGENLKRTDPAFVVRDRLLAMGRTKRDDKCEIIFRGWNAYRRKASPRQLQNLKTFPALV